MSKNKILAVSFLGLANLCFFGYYLYAEIASSFTLFRNSGDWLTLLFFFIDAAMYLILLTANIRNDDFAYTGIALFVSMETFTFIRRFLFGQFSFVTVLASGDPLAIVLGMFYILFLFGEAGVGIALYVFVILYQRGFPYFKPIRILSILFACFVSLALVSYFLIMTNFGAFSLSNLLVLFLLPLAESAASVGIIFTLERLKRI